MFETVNELFAKWLQENMDERGWNRSELARRAGLSPAAITDLFSGRRNPGKDSCTAIAGAFKIPPEIVFRVAGLLESDPDKDERLYKIENLYHTLREESNKERALQFLEFLSGLEEKDDRTGKKTKREK